MGRITSAALRTALGTQLTRSPRRRSSCRKAGKVQIFILVWASPGTPGLWRKRHNRLAQRPA
jgi:hypothetical protein